MFLYPTDIFNHKIALNLLSVLEIHSDILPEPARRLSSPNVLETDGWFFASEIKDISPLIISAV